MYTALVSNCRFAGSADCMAPFERAGVPTERRVLLEPNTHRELGDFVVHAVPADHGDLSPTALSLVVDFGGVRVMAVGDSSWRPKLFAPLYDLRPDVILPPINGVFGNMNHIDAAMMVAEAKPRLAIPCHFWTMAEQGAGDPGGFVNACARLCPEVQAVLLKPGEGILIEPRKSG